MTKQYGAIVDVNGNVIWAGRHQLTAERWQHGTFWAIADDKVGAIAKATEYSAAYQKNKHAKPGKPS